LLRKLGSKIYEAVLVGNRQQRAADGADLIWHGKADSMSARAWKTVLLRLSAGV